MKLLAASRMWTTLLLAGGLLAAGNASAYIIDFEQGATTGGTFSCSGGNCSGSGIVFTILKADTNNDGVVDTTTSDVNATLSFDTSANTLTLHGTIPSLGINAAVDLVSGSFTAFNSVTGFDFFGTGPDRKNEDLLTALGIPVDTQWVYMTFELKSINGTVNSADLQNTSVPEPATLGIFGLGLLGMAWMVRRRNRASFTA